MSFILRDINTGVEKQVNNRKFEQAIKAAHAWQRECDYGSDDKTFWVDTLVISKNGEEVFVTTTIHPSEPKCSKKKHKWEALYEKVGGLKENPGVFGVGGGVIIKEVCKHCECRKETNTWAQRSDTGEQGLTSISYE